MSNKQHKSHKKIAQEAHSEGFDDGMVFGVISTIVVGLVLWGLWTLLICNPIFSDRQTPEERRIESIQSHVENIQRELDHQEYMEMYRKNMEAIEGVKSE